MIFINILDLLNKLYNNNYLEKEEITFVLKNLDSESRVNLYKLACNTRHKYYGDKVFMRGLIEFSNICDKSCLYCGLRAQNQKIDRYRLSKEQILECCNNGYSLGYRTFVLQSGEDKYYTIDILIDIVREIKTKYSDVALTLSVGERTYEEYKKLYDAGVDRYLLRHETASHDLYKRLHPKMDFDNRIKCLYDLKSIGFQVGAGFMVGLPGQTEGDIANDLWFLKEFNPHMIGIGPFISHSETPLKDEKSGTLEDTRTALAIARLLVPDALIPATTAMGTIDKNGRELALLSGANVVMPNISPKEFRAKYELYQNKICTDDDAAYCRKCIEKRIMSTGLTIDMGIGDNIRIKFS